MFKSHSEHVVRALTIAGSDSGGGAGIQADLKTMHQFGVYGTSVVTALTAQNTQGVQGILEVPPDFVRSQLTAVATDIGMDAVKTGMLASAAIIEHVSEFLAAQMRVPLVVDPVMVAKGGAPLLAPEAVAALKRRLLPLATVATPNLPEAQALCGYPLKGFEDCRQAARDIAGLGAKFVVIKGGHTPADGDATEMSKIPPAWQRFFEASSYAVDLVYETQADTFTYFATPRVDSRKTHGTGCTYSAAIASLLARGVQPLSAVGGAKSFVYRAIESARSWDVGSGHGPTNHFVPALDDCPSAGQFNVYRNGLWSVI